MYDNGANTSICAISTFHFSFPMNTLLALDRAIFHVLNSTVANPAFDVVMPFITDMSNIVPVMIAIMLIILWQGSREDIVFMLLACCALLLADPATTYLKQTFQRSRPCQELADARALGGCGKSKSFPSGHGTNNGAVAMAAAMVFGWRASRSWWLAAGIISYSRVYMGVHYLSDVLAGMLLGAAISFCLGALWRRIFVRNTYLRIA
ncbi:MAG: phosphatase PAP2 family protein [Candidatus Kapaibacterium sp.]|nr:MAG: phosphatase PAP2 family protein [Candidatus Kapabacteria bacterium]